MKRILLAIAFALSFAALPAQAQTVTMTITATTADYNSWAAMCGTVQAKLDTQVPPQPRACTATEVKAMVNTLILQPWIDWKGAQLNNAAVKAVTVPALSFSTN